MESKFYIIENVPAWVDEKTGEQFFSPSTVERLQRIVLGQAEPSKVMETPVYEYSEELLPSSKRANLRAHDFLEQVIEDEISTHTT
jgi:hypothetical protein